MKPSARLLAVGLGSLALAVACGEIAAPIRVDFYEWRLLVPAEPGPGTDTLSFHWERSSLPVRVWVENTAGLPDHMARAITTWQSAFLYGELSAEIVGDSASADVIVRGIAAPQASRTRLLSVAPQCSGATDLDVSPDNAELRLPIRVFVQPHPNPDTPGLTECVALTSIHELGHALGIFQHSPNPTDIMFADPTVALPSELDLGTMEVAYHVPATLQAAVPPFLHAVHP
ncbi:MAG: hypothetical protein ACREMX_12005 [Gemmatimonadales bacterium]